MSSRLRTIILWVIVVLLGFIPAAMIFFVFISPRVVNQIPYPYIRDLFNAITQWLTA